MMYIVYCLLREQPEDQMEGWRSRQTVNEMCCSALRHPVTRLQADLIGVHRKSLSEPVTASNSILSSAR